MRALVVDDSQAMRMIIRRILREQGFETVEAEHGRAALSALADAGPVDLALVDWNMPEMNGLEFVEAVRADARYGGMVIMMVTTEIESAQVLRALDAGANEYLMKPFTKPAFVEKLALLGLAAA
ncbi:MAG: response regulator [bacterium]|nr:response regulator [bacterium]